MASSPPIERFFTVEIPNIDLELDPERGHTFQERQERDPRAIRLDSESPHDTPDKSDVAGLQSRVDRVEDLNNTQQAMITAQQAQITAQQGQITALSARVSDLHLMREGTATTATKQCAGAAESPLQQIRSALQTMTVNQIQQVLVMIAEELGKKLGPRPDGPTPEQAVSPLSLAVLHSKLP